MDDNQEFSAEEILNFVNGNSGNKKQEEKKPIASKIINISKVYLFKNESHSIQAGERFPFYSSYL